MRNSRIGWIGVDLDGTLALTVSNTREIGAPIAPMLARVHDWLDQGLEVRIVTARVGASGVTLRDGTVDDQCNAERQRALVEACAKCNTRKSAKLFVDWLPLVAESRRTTVARVYARKHGAPAEQCGLMLVMKAA